MKDHQYEKGEILLPQSMHEQIEGSRQMEKVPNILKDGGISRQGDIWDYTDILIFVHETLPLSDI